MAATKPRIITLTKREGQGFGFYLRVEHGEEGHLIRALEMGGPAELAGLKDGDRVVKVNNTFVDSLEHSQVADMVRKSGLTVTLHVLGEDAYKQAKASGVNLADPQSPTGQAQPALNGVSQPAPKPLLCYLQKSKTGYGFSLRSTKGDQGTFMIDIVPGEAADRAGVKLGHGIVEINGENVERATHDQIVQKVKASGDHVMFLLVDEDANKYFKNKSIRPTVDLASVKHLPHKPRIADMVKRADGYGFILKENPKSEGHYVGEIDKGSPAERAGLKVKDRVVAVNGEEINHCSHEDVVNKIRQNNNCCLLVLDAETEKMYKLGGASPLLYWEEMRASLPSTTEVELPAAAVPTPVPIPAAAVPTPVPAAMEPTPVPAAMEPTPVPAAAGPTPVPAAAGPIPVPAAMEPTPVPAAAGPIPVPAAMEPTPADQKPKLCRLEKAATGFGFHLNGIQGVNGQYIKEVVKGGAAEKAGLEDEDIVVEVNGVNVEMGTHQEVVDLIRKSGDTLVLLVAGRMAYQHLKAKGIAITPQLLNQEPSAPAPALEKDQKKEPEKAAAAAAEAQEKAETPPPVRARTPSSSSSSSSSSSAASDNSENEQL